MLAIGENAVWSAMPDEIRLALIGAMVAVIVSFGALVVRKLNSIDTAVNHRGKMQPTISEDVTAVREAAEAAVRQVNAINNQTTFRYEEINQRISELETGMLRLGRLIRIIGEALDVDLPPELHRQPKGTTT